MATKKTSAAQGTLDEAARKDPEVEEVRKVPSPPPTDLPAERPAAQPPAVVSPFEDPSEGFEEADREAYVIPFLTLLQKNSPQVDPDSERYLEGAQVGDFLNTATNEIIRGEVLVVPCKYERKFVEWVPREQGGGFRGHHDPEAFDIEKLARDDRGRFLLPNGNHLADTRYHYCLLVGEGRTPEPVVLGLTSTQIKTSRTWMTQMANVRVVNPASGIPERVNMMACVWRVKPVTQKKDDYTWKGYSFSFARALDLSKELDVYRFAREFNHQVSVGKARVEEPEPAPGGEGEAGDLF